MKIINIVRVLYLLSIVCFVADLVAVPTDSTAHITPLTIIGWVFIMMAAAMHLHTHIIEKRQTTQVQEWKQK